ncbi:hypothetical protein NIES37_44600 [Tolypothrix tenuis PCC 7101]|uniref:Probable membrane transporter protein n=1 Tax=Tolypothrix tenuis PCC 7101 TaxID=231146 RepID=A0A1Z4N418_9CYAN|nr:sulfite exporter TauE/SafE family protein [Aulosira sp. FACHB-113]BAZ00468.1 hypothetical protein NIES37_44600 [Tolypothrix tenuis PCC 7101]BAZ75610.1 hypothetical protein NIES50_41980 [Aulosira laxa NIES-50]
MESEVAVYLLIALLGSTASFFGALVGGSGLVILPGLISLGFSAPESVALLEVGALGMMLTSALQFHRADKIDYSLAVRFTAFSGLGALTGAILLLRTAPVYAEKIMGIALLLIFACMVLWKQEGIYQGEERPHPRISPTLGAMLFYANGVWSGFLSAGSHIIGNFILVFFFRRTLLESAGILKIEGIGAGIVTTLIFSWAGIVTWGAALVLSLSMSIGAWCGCQFGLRLGDVNVRWLYLSIVLISAVKLLR